MTRPSKKLTDTFYKLSTRKFKAITIGICIACGTCIQFCPLNLRKFNKNGAAMTIKSTKNCNGCSVCVKRCPQQAIELIEINK